MGRHSRCISRKYSLGKELFNSFIHSPHELKDFIVTLNYCLLQHIHRKYFSLKDETNFIFHNLHFQKTHSGTIIYFSAIGGYFGLNLSSDASNQPPGSQSLSNVQFWGSVTGFYMQNKSKITHLAECRYDTKTAVVMGDIILFCSHNSNTNQ